MCQELNEELQRGKEAALDLIEHLERMGGGKMELPIETNNGCYRVTVIKTL